MAATKQLAAVARSGTGKGAARSVRREGRVPAVIYGGGLKPEPISVDYKDVNRLIYSGGFLTTIFELEMEGRKERVLPRDYQLDVVTDRPVHVDFLRLAPGSRVRIGVPVHVVNREGSSGPEKGRRGQSRAAHGRGDGAGRRHSGIDHHRPHGPRFSRLRARVGDQAAGGLPSGGRESGPDGGDDRPANSHGRGDARDAGGRSDHGRGRPPRQRPAAGAPAKAEAAKGAAAPAKAAAPAAAAKPAAKK